MLARTIVATVGSWSHWAPATLPSIQNMTVRSSVGVAQQLHEAGRREQDVADRDPGEHQPGGGQSAPALAEGEDQGPGRESAEERRAGHAETSQAAERAPPRVMTRTAPKEAP